MSGSDPFNIQLPKLKNQNDGDLFSNENGSHNPENSIFDSDGCSSDQNPNNGASQSDCMEYLEKQQDQDNIDLNEDKQAHNEGNDKANIINLMEDSKEDFLIENTFEYQSNGNNNFILSFEDFVFQNNHSLTEQGSTSENTPISSQKFNSGTNEENKGANNCENNFAINNENNSADSESNKEGKVETEEEEPQKFDLIKDSNSKHNSGNAHSEEIKGKKKIVSTKILEI